MVRTPEPTGTTSRPRSSGAPTSLAGGRYRLGELIGTGGMGLVHRAHDDVLGRDVAVKLLADNLAADAEARRRFEREAQAAARLTHPNVVQVYDVGEEDGRPYFVMELVDGPSLADLLHTRGTLPAREVEAVAIDALRGLARAHAAGLLHRDLKPGNLMRAPDGTVKVTDFGVAQATELPQMTRTGLVLGTLPYLAPERLTGAPASVRTDLYGLGATLLELLTGAPPDTRLDTSGVQVHGPGDLDTVPPSLAGLVQRCLAKDPEERPVSAEAALDLLTGSAPLPPRLDDDRTRTQVLPAVHDAPTQVVGSSRDDAPTQAVGALDEADPVTEPHPLRARGWTRWLALGGLAALLVAALIGLGNETATTPPPAQDAPAETPAPEVTTDTPSGETPADATLPDGGAPPGDTPAETVENLRDWILDQAG